MFPFSGLTMLVGQQERRLPCKKTGCQCVGGYILTGVFARLIVLAQLSPPSPSSLAAVKSRMETFCYRCTQAILETVHQMGVSVFVKTSVYTQVF